MKFGTDTKVWVLRNLRNRFAAIHVGNLEQQDFQDIKQKSDELLELIDRKVKENET